MQSIFIENEIKVKHKKHVQHSEMLMSSYTSSYIFFFFFLDLTVVVEFLLADFQICQLFNRVSIELSFSFKLFCILNAKNSCVLVCTISPNL